MGDGTKLGPFVNEDSFLRHADRKKYVKNGIVAAGLFEVRSGESTLSFTHQDESLRSDDALDRYQQAKELPSGDLVGLCKLTYQDLTQSLEPPLPPRRDPVPEKVDPKYGHRHCCTDVPRDVVHRTKMAELANRNGIVRLFVPKRKRTPEVPSD